MPESVAAAVQMIGRCLQLREQGRPEAVLRGELASRLRQVFPDDEDQRWIDHYMEGTEAHTRLATESGRDASRFVDNLVRATVIEFEPDLRRENRWNQGFEQVREYAAGQIRSGVAASEVRGVLSDTVDWHVYDVELSPNVAPADCTPEDVLLQEVASLTVTAADEPTAERLIDLLRRHLAREQSRALRASLLATDLGLESQAYARHVDSLVQLVIEGRASDDSIALATDLWSAFVDYLETEPGDFRVAAYVHEAYIAIMARLLCVNILERVACRSDDSDLRSILRGEYFEQHFHLHNMVERDYFGWLLGDEQIERLLPIAREIQHDLYAYDFRSVLDDDLFGKLMSQLARRTKRKLLGQEWTPAWVARALADKCIAALPDDDAPRIIDMCCGSGSILAEVIKATKRRYPALAFSSLANCITGLDIDPLAVILAKTTWVVTLAEQVRSSPDQITIPVFHADSLFAVTPVSRDVPMPGDDATVVVDLEGVEVRLPGLLIAPDFRVIFDDVIDWCYDEARAAQLNGDVTQITEERTAELLSNLVDKHNCEVPADAIESINSAVYQLAHRMATLAVTGRNGIWAFILKNTYKPGLLAGQFNGLVCNPPWLAMSQFADNPYKAHLSERARAYGIKPAGAAHLHLELATTHLIHAVDRYLAAGAQVSCLVPGTVFKGQHHGKLRQLDYLEADRAVPFELKEVWEVAPGTFKVRAAALIGVKRDGVDHVSRDVPRGAVMSDAGVQYVPLSLRRLGTRTAWRLGEYAEDQGEGTGDAAPQGADIMPRSAVCVTVLSQEGSEWRVRTPRRDDPGYFAIRDSKMLEGQTFNGSVAPCFIHRLLLSKNVLPFALDPNLVHVALPARRLDDRSWEILTAGEIRTAGFTNTARRFQRVDRAMKQDGIVKPLHEYINTRNKLTNQQVSVEQTIVVYGAGGGIACAAMLAVADYPDVIVDQTLYWCICATEEEARFRVGLINTDAVTEATREFNPEGELGPRHLHSLPNRVLPAFDPDDEEHMRVVQLALELERAAQQISTTDEYISDSTKSFTVRRRRLRQALQSLDAFAELEAVAESVLLGA